MSLPCFLKKIWMRLWNVSLRTENKNTFQNSKSLTLTEVRIPFIFNYFIYLKAVVLRRAISILNILSTKAYEGKRVPLKSPDFSWHNIHEPFAYKSNKKNKNMTLKKTLRRLYKRNEYHIDSKNWKRVITSNTKKL